jgi:hypothetical protein
MEAGLARAVEQADWKNAAIDAGNLAELLLTLGRLGETRPSARRRERARRSPTPTAAAIGSCACPIAPPTPTPSTNAAGGKRPGPSSSRRSACRRIGSPSTRCSTRSQGYRYGDLLLSLGQPTEAWRRAEWVAMRNGRDPRTPLLDIALDHLLLGRAAADLADFTPAAQHLDAAVTGLRKAGTQHHLPRGLLARAALYRRTHHFDLAHRDLTEAHTIATRGGMRLHLCDYHLESARLHLAQDHLDLARDHYASRPRRGARHGLPPPRPRAGRAGRRAGAAPFRLTNHSDSQILMQPPVGGPHERNHDLCPHGG